MLLISNFCKFAEFCFWPVIFWTVLGLLIFTLSNSFRHKELLRLILLMGGLMLCWRLFLPINSKRYMAPVALMAMIFAGQVIIWSWRHWNSRTVNKWILRIILVGSIGLSIGKIFHRSEREKDKKILRAAELLYQDFKKNHYRHAVLLGNTKECGRIMFYAGIPGEFFSIFSEEAMQDLIFQTSSQTDVVYVVNDYKQSNLPKPDTIHSYRWEPISKGIGLTTSAQEYYLGKLFSFSQLSVDKKVIDKHSGLRDDFTNSNFKIPGVQSIPSQAIAQFPFLQGKSELVLPKNWFLDVNNQRGTDFSDWGFVYRKDDGVFSCYGEGGVAFRFTERSLPQDCSLLFIGNVAPTTNLYLFLYAYDKNGKLLGVQNVGFLGNHPSGRLSAIFTIRAKDLPLKTSFFNIGFISWGGVIKLEKLTVISMNKIESKKYERE